MKNTTPILVLTGLAIVAALGIAGLTREQWMGQPTPAVATPETAAPAATAETATQEPAPAPAPAAEQPATTAETAETAPAPAAESQQTAAAQTEQTPPAVETQPEPAAQPAAEPAAEPASNAAPTAEVPAFDTVRVEKTGEAVIAGRAEAGSEVVVKLDGEAIGKATANEDGSFVVVPEAPLPSGSSALTIEAKGKGDLNPVPSEQSVAVMVPAGQEQEALVAVVSPDAPTKVLQKPEAPAAAESAPATEAPAAEAPAAEAPAAEQKPAKLVSIDAVDYDAAGNIVFSGQGEKGNIARIYVDNTFVGDAAVGEDGRWIFSGTADVAQGVHTLRVDGLDAKGNVLNRVEVPFFREDQTKVAEVAPPAAVPAQPAAEAGAGTETPEPPAAAPEAPAPEAQPVQQQETAQKTEETAAAAAQPKPTEGRIVIQPGNNLWRISRVLYGSGEKFTMIYEANKDQIRNPNLIYPGQVFRTPDVAPKAETVDPHRRNPLTPDENAAAE